MYQKSRYLERELEITRIYKKYRNENKAIREAKVLETQIPLSFMSDDEKRKDLFVCFIDRPFIGYYNQLDADGIDKTGYCINNYACKEELEKMKADDSYTFKEINEAEEMLDFWQTENTLYKIHQRFTPEMNQSLASDDFNNSSAAVYPLYRLAGTHLNLEKLFAIGIVGMIQEIEDYLLFTTDEEKRNYYKGTKMVLETMISLFHSYEDDVKEKIFHTTDQKRIKELERIRESLSVIQKEKPHTMHQCMQLAVLYMSACRSSEMGRIDDILCTYYKQDLESGLITRGEAVDLVASFFDLVERGIGRDARAIIGGLGRKHEKLADEFALVIMDATIKRDGSYLPQLSLRYYTGINQEVFDKGMKMLSNGRTFPLLYNDDVNVPSVMRAMDVSRKVAEQYSFFGCGEYMLIHKSIGTPNALINVSKLVELTLHNGYDRLSNKVIGPETGEITDDMTFEQLMERYEEQTKYATDLAGDFKQLVYDVSNEEASCLMISALYDNCIERGRALLDGGIYHLGGTVETYGNITAADSLTAIKYVVFDKKEFSLTHLVKAIDADFKGYEREQKLLIKAPKFGNDDDYADDIAVRVHENLCNHLRNQRLRTRLDSLLAVIINNNMNVAMGRNSQATPDGRNSGVFISNGINPYNSRDKEGITAVFQSMSKMDTSIHAGGNQNIKLSPKMFEDDCKVAKELVLSFFKLGGQQTNITVVDQKELEDAMVNPKDHENLFIRVGGYTARFIQLDPPTQREILSRTAY